MTMTQEKSWAVRSQEIAQNTMAWIVELFEAYETIRYDEDDEDWDGIEFDGVKFYDEDDIRTHASEQALSLELRSDWHTPGEDMTASEFRLLLSTGGPAAQIVGKIGSWGDAEDFELQVQDWFQPWTQASLDAWQSEALEWFVSCFYFGE
jgi:hypothetical protein